MFLESLEPRAMMAIAPIPGTPFGNFEGNNYPPQHFQAGTLDYLSGPATGNKLDIAVGYLKDHAGDFGLTRNDFNYLAVTSQYEADSGITNIYFQQTFNGLPVADAHANVNVASDGRVLTAGVNFVPGLVQPAFITPVSPGLGPQDAINLIAYDALLTPTGGMTTLSTPTGHSLQHNIMAPGVSVDPIPVELQYVPMEGGGVQLAWRVIIRTPDGQHWYDAAVGAEGSNTGWVIRVSDWVDAASYNVFPVPTRHPLDGPRSIVVNPQNSVASPRGWHDDGIITFLDTRGNNVLAQEDTNGDDLGGLRPVGGPTLDFNSPLVLPGAPATFTDASVTNAFYWANYVHDVTYRHGFNEKSGNFQTTNFTGSGKGSDPVIVDVQDPIAILNAFMATPPDGRSGRLTIGLNPLAAPGLDLALQNDIIVHEYGHGISNRLTGGPGNANALDAVQSRGLGEGWSDWLGVLFTMKPTDTATTPRVIGDYAFGFGIRRFPYSFDMSVSPLRLGMYNGDFFPFQNNSEEHNSGEIWAAALLDMTWLLIDKHGFTTNLMNPAANGGQNVAMRLVFKAMQLQPGNPTFTEARDAILAADLALYGGDHFNEIWTAFARRGLGLFAESGRNANSLLVDESFVMPNPPARVSGVVFVDRDGDGQRDAGEAPLEGWTVYIDSNNNGELNAGERRDTTDASGRYSFNVLTDDTFRIRQVVQGAFHQTFPSGAHVVNVSPGTSRNNLNFGNQENPGQVKGLKWHDENGDGIRDPGEPGLGGIVIYVDYNNDGRIGLLEPATVTGSDGRYTIPNVQPGTYTVREVFQPGLIQTFPDPEGTGAGAHTNVVVTRGQITNGIDFGNETSIDFGDAPNFDQTGFPKSYPTLLAQNGARHGVLPGFGLGPAVDGELDGQPTNNNALGDGADDDGVVVVGLTPGETATAIVTVRTGGFSSGLLHGWIDWNRDGDWGDAGEKIISGRRLGAGVHNVQFAVPAGATLGPVYARFRYGFESTLGPAGAASAGEVEDYRLEVLNNVPVARDDFYGASFGTQPIKQGSTNNVLNVLANDFGITSGGTAFPPQIDLSTLPSTTTQGGTITYDAVNRVLLYTPNPNDIGIDTFTYRVTAGGEFSAFATVTIDITSADPEALDDTFTFQFQTPPLPHTLNVLANDVSPNPAAMRIVGVQPVTLGMPASSMLISPGGTTLIFTAPVGFEGTAIYAYTIDDNDPITNPATALVTVQVVDFTGGVPDPVSSGYMAQLSAQILDLNGNPVSTINQGDEFLVLVTSRDFRPGNFNDRGVVAAYVDLLFDRNLAEPVLDPNNPLGFAIDFADLNTGGDRYSFAQRGEANSPAPGAINEAGGTFGGVGLAGPGTGEREVFFVRMRATGLGNLIVRTDHADVSEDGTDFSRILLFNPGQGAPIELTDEQVYLRASSPVQIVGAGEGEFTNRTNRLDVSNDGFVTPIDALMVINDLNRNGSRELSQEAFAMGSVLPPSNYLDVNTDAVVAPIDALIVINYLNAQSASSPTSGGAGEGESASVLAAPAAPATAATALPAAQETGEGESDLLGTSVLLQDAAIQSLLAETSGALAAGASSGAASYGPQREFGAKTSLLLPAMDETEEDDSLLGESQEVLDEAVEELLACLAESPRLDTAEQK